jgi:hypothetical protein
MTDSVEIVVEFNQRFTVTPPDQIDDQAYAKLWFRNTCGEIGRDVLDTKNGDNYEVIEVREADDD